MAKDHKSDVVFVSIFMMGTFLSIIGVYYLIMDITQLFY